MMTDKELDVKEDLGPVLGDEIEADVPRFDSIEEPKDMRENIFYEEEDDMDREEIPKSTLEQTIPVDKLKNGAANAYRLWSWSLEKIREEAVKVNEKLEESENFQKMKESYDANVKPAVDTAVEKANALYEDSKPKLAELSESAKENINTLVERSGPVLAEVQEKVSKSVEACKPTLIQVKENAAEGIHQASEEIQKALGGGNNQQ